MGAEVKDEEAEESEERDEVDELVRRPGRRRRQAVSLGRLVGGGGG